MSFRSAFAVSLGAAGLGIVACRDAVAPSAILPLHSIASIVTLDSARLIKLTYICGNRFRVRNPVSDTTTVTWDVYGTTTSGKILLPARPDSSAYSETYFDATVKGTVRVFWRGNLIQTKANGSTNCAPTLVVISDAGISGIVAGKSTFVPGATYSYSATSVVGNLRPSIAIDGHPVPASGSVIMSADHLLIATLVPIPQDLSSVDPSIVVATRRLIADNGPVSAFQDFAISVGNLSRSVGVDEADRQVRLAVDATIDLVRDSLALRHLRQAIGGQFVEIDSTPVLTLPARSSNVIPADFPFQPSGGLGSARRLPADVPRFGHNGVAQLGGRGLMNVSGGGSVGFDPNPIDIYYTNGIWTEPWTAVIHVMRLRELLTASAVSQRGFRIRLVYNETNDACINNVLSET